MTGPVSVRAGWAIWSKQQASRDDYSVLAASAEPFSRSEVERVLAHFAPGNPPAETGATSSLPWVMLSRVGVADKPYVGVSVQDAAGYVDGTGRPVSRTRYLCVSYQEMAANPVSYLGLHQAASSVPLPAEDDAQVTLAVPPLDPGALAQDIAGFGVDFVAATAALLLAGPVTITGPELPGWQVRLRFLDAVAALLPYGYRAHYTASTWSDTGASASRYRIVFARRAGDKSFAVPWGTVPQVGLGNPYHASLRRMARPSGDIADLEALIDYLARQTGQGRFDEPRHAVAAIRGFRPAGMIAEDIDARIANPSVVREAFDRNLDRQWPPDTLRKALAALIKTANPEDETIVGTRLPMIGDESARELLPDITAACGRLLPSGEGMELIRLYLRALRDYRLDDPLLASLLPSPGQTPEDGHLEITAALVADFACTEPGRYHETRRALAGNPAVVAALIAHLCAARGGPEATGAIGWLEPGLDHALRLFRLVLAPAAGGGIEPEDLRDLGARGGPAAVRYLLRAASSRENLRLVLPEAACWLCQQSSSGDGTVDARSWQDAAMMLAPRDEGEAAWLDLVLLAAHADPRSLTSGKYATPGFARTLVHVWGLLTEALNERVRLGLEADTLLTNSLIDYLRRTDWRADPVAASVVGRLAELLAADGRRPLLAAEVRDVETALRGISPQAAVAHIAETGMKACSGGMEPDQVATALAASGAIASGERAADVLDHLHWMLLTDPRFSSAERREYAAEWEFRLAEMFARGALGERVAREFTMTTARNSMTELRHHFNMLNMAVENRISDTPPVLNNNDIITLNRWHTMLRRLIDDAASRGDETVSEGGTRPWWKPRMVFDTRDAGGDAG